MRRRILFVIKHSPACLPDKCCCVSCNTFAYENLFDTYLVCSCLLDDEMFYDK